MKSKKTPSKPRYNINIYPPQQQKNLQQNKTTKIEKQLNQTLDLLRFKVFPCQIKQLHNQKQCKYYHSQQDRRRQLMFDAGEMCQYIKQGNNIETSNNYCADGDQCPYYHNKTESLYSQQKYKVKFCIFFPNDCHNCQYGDYCPFAHNQQQIRVELIHSFHRDADFFMFHYKTVMCPFRFQKNSNEHDLRRCVYAHNFQDFRRKPQIYNYEPVPCATWNPNSFVTNYYNQCKNMMNCNKCHGWKQLEYHPHNYKMKQCMSQRSCKKQNYCPYYHRIQQKKVIGQKIKSGFFIYFPRNRQIEIEIKNSLQMTNFFTSGHSSTSRKSSDDISDLSSERSSKSNDQIKQDQEISKMVKQILKLS